MAATSPATRRTFWGLGTALFLAVLAALALANLQEFFRVKRVIDGDTIMLESGERVHLIGVDTPETDHPKKQVERLGKEASAFTRRMTRGKRVRLEYDPANSVREHKDSTAQKGTLAYVFLEDGTLLNAEISGKDTDSCSLGFRSHAWKNFCAWSGQRGRIAADYGRISEERMGNTNRTRSDSLGAFGCCFQAPARRQASRENIYLGSPTKEIERSIMLGH